MAKKFNQEMIDWTYENLTAEFAPFREKYPNKAIYMDKLRNDPAMGEWVYNNFAKEFKPFAKQYPSYGEWASFSGFNKYTTKQKDQIREAAKEGMEALYGGDFDKLWTNKDKLPAMLKRAKLDFAAEGNVSTTKAQEIDKKIQKLEQGMQLVDAYDAVLNAKDDGDFDSLFDGVMPSTELSTDSTTNPFLKQVMPSVNYKVMELEGESPSITEGLFPEASRRARRNEGAFSSAMGGVKDVLRLPGRALRPIGESAMGIDSPGLSYWEELARPDKYKTGAQEVFDEIVGFQGVGGAAGRKVGAKALGGLAKWGNWGNKTANTINKGMNVVNPANIIFRGSTPSTYNQAMLKGAVNMVPETALDVAYEATRSGDEQSNPGLAGLGGLGGGAIGGAAAKKFGQSALGSALGMGEYSLNKEIAQGSPEYLRDQLRLAKSLQPNAAKTSEGGLTQLRQLDRGIQSEIKRISELRDASIGKVDEDIIAEYDNMIQQLEDYDTEVRMWISNEMDNQMGSEMVGGDGVDAMNDLYDAAPAPEVSPLLAKSLDLPATYRREIAKQAASEHPQFIKELEAATGVNISDAPLGGADYSPLQLQGRSLDQLHTTYDNPLSGSNIEEAREGFTKLESIDPITRQKEIDSRLMDPGFDLSGDALQTGAFDGLGPAAKLETRYPIGEFGQEAVPSIEKAVKGRTHIREIAQKQKRRSKGDASVGIFGDAEDIQKNVMKDLLKEAGPEGQKALKAYNQLAKRYNLQDQLPDLTTGKSVDSWLDNIAAARLNLTSKSNQFNDMVRLQKQLNVAAGLPKDQHIDYITDAILRKIDQPNFLSAISGLSKGEITGSLVSKIAGLGKQTIRGWIQGGTFGRNILKLADSEKDVLPAKDMRPAAKESASLMNDPRMKEVLTNIEKRKQTDSINLAGQRR